MSLQIYVYDAADHDEPHLVAELDALVDAVARCHDLVENDGHPRAEAWDDDGDCHYGVAVRGGVLRTYGVRGDDPPRDDPRPPLPARPSPPRPPTPDDLLRGEDPTPPDRWFGM